MQGQTETIVATSRDRPAQAKLAWGMGVESGRAENEKRHSDLPAGNGVQVAPRAGAAQMAVQQREGLSELARIYGISKQRVWQIVHSRLV